MNLTMFFNLQANFCVNPAYNMISEMNLFLSDGFVFKQIHVSYFCGIVFPTLHILQEIVQNVGIKMLHVSLEMLEIFLNLVSNVLHEPCLKDKELPFIIDS